MYVQACILSLRIQNVKSVAKLVGGENGNGNLKNQEDNKEMYENMTKFRQNQRLACKRLKYVYFYSCSNFHKQRKLLSKT